MTHFKNVKYSICKNLMTTLNLALFILLTSFKSNAFKIEKRSVQTSSLAPTKVLLLVPGFFNSFAPEYFSKDIIQTLKNNGFSVYVAEGLNPIGTIEENGHKVLSILNRIKKNNPQSTIGIVGHSAGGLYSLYAIHQGANYVKTLTTISTPFNGVEFVEQWDERMPLFHDLMNLCSLDGLKQLTKPYVSDFISKLRLHDDLRIYAFAGYQPTRLDFWDAANKTTVLSVTDQFITGASDGIVGFSSAITPVKIKTTHNNNVYFYTDKQFYFNLEHWEQVLESESFLLLGVRNTNLIKERQIKLYSMLGQFINTQLY